MARAPDPAKLPEFEVLRAVAILLLMVVHCDLISLRVGGVLLEPIGPFLGAFLLGSFFFMAGFFAERSFRKPEQRLFSFLWAKVIRIFPPYWLSLVAFVYILGYSLKRFEVLVYGLNLQVIFSPAYAKPLLTLWYVSMVMAFYIFFGFLLSRRVPGVWLLVFSMLIFSTTYALHAFTGLVDPRFFEYLIIFVAGIYVSRYPSANAWMYNAHPAVVVPLALISAWLYGLCEVARLPVQSWQFLFSVVLFIITWISIALRLFRRAGPSLAFWIPISTASFFAYLLHRPIWAILESQIVVEPGVQRALFRLIPGTIVVMILCYFLQRGYDGLLVRLKHLKPGNPPMHSSRTG